MTDSPERKVPTAVRLSFAALSLALVATAAAVVGGIADAFPVRIVLIVTAVIAIAGAGACLGAAQRFIRSGGAEQA